MKHTLTFLIIGWIALSCNKSLNKIVKAHSDLNKIISDELVIKQKMAVEIDFHEQNEKLKGTVKSVLARVHKAKFIDGQILKDGIPEYSYEKNTLTIYDEIGRIKQINYLNDSTEVVESNEIITYDKDGCIEKIKEVKNGVLLSETNYLYDLKSLIVTEICINNKNEVIYKATSKFDQNCKFSEREWYSLENGKIKTKSIHKYSFKEATQLNSNFDENEKLTDETFHSFNHDFNYVTSVDTKDSTIIKNFRDKDNNLTASYYYSKKYETTQNSIYAYKYDKKSNWITCIEFENDEPKKIIERKIIYKSEF